MNLDLRIFQLHGSHRCLWFRMLGRGMHFIDDAEPRLFSECNRPALRVVGWRMKVLRAARDGRR